MAIRSLSSRVTLTASLVVALVIGLFAAILHHEVQGAIRTWELAHLAALGHHLQAMLVDSTPEGRDAVIEKWREPLAAFGVSARISPPAPSLAAAIVLPIGPEGGNLVVAPKDGERAGGKLARRLAALYLALTAAVLVVLLAAIRLSIVIGLERPLAGLRRQLRSMERGPWHVHPPVHGAVEVDALASELERLGALLELKVTSWVAAERRAGAELARIHMRKATMPLHREVNLLASLLLAPGDLSPDARRRLRALVLAAENLTSSFDGPLEELDLRMEPHFDEPALVVSPS